MKTRTVEEKYYFVSREDLIAQVDEWMRDQQIDRVWFTDRFWLKDDPKRYEVIIHWEEV
jgi:hypothetical protein